MKARIGTLNYDDKRAQGGGHPPVLATRALAPGQGVLPTGLLLAKSATGAVPYEEIAAEAIAAGTGALKDFAATLAKAPIHPGTVIVTDGVETLSDDGCGRLVGSAGGSGTVHYGTGALTVAFAAAPANGAGVTAAYARQIAGVLDEETDTAVTGSGLVIIHGSVRADVLGIGATTKTAPSVATLARLQDAGIYAA